MQCFYYKLMELHKHLRPRYEITNKNSVISKVLKCNENFLM